MEDKMTIAELIEYLKTLKQDYFVTIGDSEYPSDYLTKDSITEVNNNTYMIY
jgi:hypothetical protein